MVGLVERDVAVRLGLLASLAGEHLLMIGPPGTAKSLIARRLHLAFEGATYFERLLTRFTVPEELFGPLSIKGLEEDRYERLTDAYLPKASLAFLDEIFKANSAILNALLTLLNERQFDNGAVREQTPLVAVIGASNELPEGEELDALFDRFLLRLHVGPVTKGGFRDLLRLRGQTPPQIPDELKLHRHELEAVRAAAETVVVPDDVVGLLCDLRDWCTAEEIRVSDRRWRKVVKLLQVCAATNGRSQVSVWDCWLLQHCLWDTPAASDKVYDWYAARVGASATMDPSRLTKMVAAWEESLEADQGSRSQMRDREGHPLYDGPDREHTKNARALVQAKRGSEPLFLAPSGAQGNNRRVHERRNGGHGYSRNELDALRVREPSEICHFRTWSGRDAYLQDQSNWLMEEVDLTPVLEPTRHKVLYIEGCLGQLDELRTEVESYRGQLLAHIETLQADIREHLWVTPDFEAPAKMQLTRARKEVDMLLSRVASLREGFEALPREGSPDTASSSTESESPVERAP